MSERWLQRLDSNQLGGAPEGASGPEKQRSDDPRQPERTPFAHEVSRADPVIEALERGLTDAVAAKEWARVAILAREMANRQEARTSGNVLDSVTKEQAETIFPVLSQEQQVMLANFIRLGVEAQAVSPQGADARSTTSTDGATAAAVANGAAAKEKN